MKAKASFKLGGNPLFFMVNKEGKVVMCMREVASG